jgi:hypothetical protein
MGNKNPAGLLRAIWIINGRGVSGLYSLISQSIDYYWVTTYNTVAMSD